MIRKEIYQKIKKFFPLKADFTIEKPEREAHGDYSSNIAFQLSKIFKKSPTTIARSFKKKLERDKEAAALFTKIEEKDGFLNFYLSKETLQRELRKILRNRIIKKLTKRKKINVEFISANPTGPLHIGNGRGAFYGDCLARILKRAGFSVTKEYFINDARTNTQIRELGKTVLGLGKNYLTPYLEEQIRKYQDKIRKNWSPEEAGYFMSQIILRDIKKFLDGDLKIKFDVWRSEDKLLSRYSQEKIIKELKRKKLVYQKEDALWLKTSQFGDSQDWVLVRKNGFPTYLFSDLIYHYDKIKRGYQVIIDIWGADHQAHVQKMEAVMKILGYKGEFRVLISQMVTLKGGGKFSKRKGEIITLEELLKAVGLDVMRYFYLTKSLESSMVFDLNLAREQSQKNPVFYIQYAYARINSILAKSEMKPKYKILSAKLELLNHPSELRLIKQLIRFPEIIEDTVNDYQVHRLTKYVFDVASLFHRFYQDCRVLGAEKDLSKARLALVLATKIILEECLELLGISKPKRM